MNNITRIKAHLQLNYQLSTFTHQDLICINLTVIMLFSFFWEFINSISSLQLQIAFLTTKQHIKRFPINLHKFEFHNHSLKCKSENYFLLVKLTYIYFLIILFKLSLYKDAILLILLVVASIAAFFSLSLLFKIRGFCSSTNKFLVPKQHIKNLTRSLSHAVHMIDKIKSSNHINNS